MKSLIKSLALVLMSVLYSLQGHAKQLNISNITEGEVQNLGPSITFYTKLLVAVLIIVFAIIAFRNWRLEENN